MVILLLMVAVAIVIALALFAKLCFAWRAGQRNTVIVLAAIITPILLGVAAFAFSTAQVATQPVITCAPVQGAATQPPASLITAQDYFAQGDYQFDLGNCDGAIAAYTRAIELKPDFAEAYNNRAFTYMVKKDYAPALPDLDRAIQLRPNYVNALMNRGDIYNYYYEIDRQRAIVDYNRVLALGPDAVRNTSLCGHLAMAHNQGNLVGALVELLNPIRPADTCGIKISNP